MPEKNVHSGHRERVKRKYLDHGLDVFEPHEALELMLFYVVPYKDTNALAHMLLSKFGSISAILDAPFDVLTEAGLTENQATFLKLLPDCARLYISDKHDNADKIINFSTIASYITSKFIGRVEENMLLLLMDTKQKELFCGIISKGNINSTAIPVRKIVDLSMRYDATCAVIAHNHPSGFAIPSQEDLVTTKNIHDALSLVGVNLLDHYIVADGECVSLLQSGFMKY